MAVFVAFLVLPLIFVVLELLTFRSYQKYLPHLTTLLSFILLILLAIIYRTPNFDLLKISLVAKVPIDISFRIDLLGWLACFFCCIVWLTSSMFSIYYMKHETYAKTKRYQVFSILNLYVILMIFISSNMITYFVFFELLLIVSYILIIHYQTPETFAAGMRYLFFQIIGGLILLFGVILTYAVLKTTSFNPGGNPFLIQNSSAINPLLPSLIFWCYVIGFSIKAGLFPVHIWLPEAHPVAPAPASALLSGMVIKTGTFGLMRVFMELFGLRNLAGRTDVFVLIILAVFTMFWGSAIAIGQGHLKRVLAYSSVSQIGYIIMGIAFLSPLSLLGALLHTLGHSLVKSLLFLSAGSIVNDTGEVDVSKIDGYGMKNPFIFSAFTVGALSMIGFPLFVNFITKWTLGIGTIEAYRMGLFPFWMFITALSILLISSILNAAYYAPIIIRGWFYPPADGSSKKYPLHLSQVASLSLLMILVVGLGIISGPFISNSIKALSHVIPFADFPYPF